MNATSAAPPASATSGLGAQADQFWRSRAPRERLAMLAMSAALALLAVWLVAVQPAWRTLRDAPAQLDVLDEQLHRMQLTATEVRMLRGASPVSPAQAATALRAATERLGDRAKLSVQGDRATLTLSGVSSEDLRAWLNEARSAARARPVEGQLLRAAQGYNGTLALTLGGTS